MRTRMPVPTVALAAIATCFAMPAAASAQGTITDAPATFVRGASAFDGSPEANFTGVSATTTQDHVFETGWWVRIGAATQETAFPAPATQNYTGNTSTITWTNLFATGVDATETSVVTSTGGPSGRVQQTMTLANTTGAPIDVTLFHMVDFDVQPTAGNDSAKLLPDGTIRVTDASSGNFADYRSGNVTDYLVRPFGASDIGAELGNATLSTFGNTGLPFGPGDFTGGLQFETISIPPGQTRQGSVTISVNDASPTVTTASVSPSPSTVGGTTTLRAEIPAASAGTVQFMRGGTPVGPPAAVSPEGVATLPVSDFTAGPQPITAIYSGTSNRQGSTSAEFAHTVEATADASLTLTCDQEADVGGTFACAATSENAGPGPVQGNVVEFPLPAGATFAALDAPDWDCMTPVVGSSGTVTCARATQASGATSTIGLTLGVLAGTEPGPLAITATATPASADSDADDRTASDPVAVFVTAPASLGATPNPSAVGQDVTLTATLANPGATTPTGTVQFKDGGADLGAPVPVAGDGTAALTTSALAAGVHTLSAVYSGDGKFRPSTSASVAQTVNAPPGAGGSGGGGSGGGGSGGGGGTVVTGTGGPLGTVPTDPGISFRGVQKRVTLSSKGGFGLRFGATGGVPLSVDVTAVVPGTKKKGKRKATKARTVKLYAGRGVVADSKGNVAVRVTLSKALRAKLPRSRKSFAATLTVKAAGKTLTHKFTLVRAKAKPKKKK